MEETEENKIPESPPKRPGLLNILCILTFIGSGMSLFSNMIIGLFYDQFTTVATSINESLHLPGMEMILEGRPSFFVSSAIFNAGCIAGAILMWRLRKAGFHVYTIFQILLILAPMYFFHLPIPSVLDILLSGTFIVLYGSNLKYMS